VANEVCISIAGAEVHEVCACCDFPCHHQHWLIVGFQVLTLSPCDVAHVGFTKSTRQATSRLHVGVESAVVAIVCKVCARCLWPRFKPHARHCRVVARWSLMLFLHVWIADETRNWASLLHPCGVDPTVALGRQVRATRKSQEALTRVNLKACGLWRLVLATRPAIFVFFPIPRVRRCLVAFRSCHRDRCFCWHRWDCCCCCCCCCCRCCYWWRCCDGWGKWDW